MREDAPPSVRSFVLRHLSEEARGDIHGTRKWIGQMLNVVFNPSKQSVAEMWEEIDRAVQGCAWFLVYDLIEELYRIRNLRGPYGRGNEGEAFAEEVNDFLEQEHVGWQLCVISLGGTSIGIPKIVVRGGEAFETVVSSAPAALLNAGMTTAADEIHQAIADLSRRPAPDLTGAVQHGMAALECAGKHACGLTGRQTLDDVVKARPELFRPPLNEAILKLWGFASNRGRHLMEGGGPTYAEVELVVGVAATVASYLSRIGLPA